MLSKSTILFIALFTSKIVDAVWKCENNTSTTLTATRPSNTVTGYIASSTAPTETTPIIHKVVGGRCKEYPNFGDPCPLSTNLDSVATDDRCCPHTNGDHKMISYLVDFCQELCRDGCPRRQITYGLSYLGYFPPSERAYKNRQRIRFIVPREGASVTITTKFGKTRAYYIYDWQDGSGVPNASTNDGELPTNGTEFHLQTRKDTPGCQNPQQKYKCINGGSLLSLRVWADELSEVEIVLRSICCNQARAIGACA